MQSLLQRVACDLEPNLWRGANSDGLYFGRIWYSYPVNGLAAGDFTSTVVGDSFLIKEGKLEKPLAPNRLRINDSFVSLFDRIIGVGSEGRVVVNWDTDCSFMHLPAVAFDNVTVEEIGKPGDTGT